MLYEKYLSNAGEVFITYDEFPESPRDWDNLWQWVSNRRYDSYNESNYSLEEICENKELRKDYIIAPVYMYDHSIVRLSTRSFIGRAPHAEWDSGVGFFAIVSKAQLRKEFSCKRITKAVIDKAMKILESECQCMDAYMNGEVYWYHVNDENGEEIDNCAGYYGAEGIKAIREMYPEIVNEPKIVSIPEHNNRA